MLNPALWYTLINGLLIVYPSKQQAFQGLNQFQDFNFYAMLRPWFVRTKKQSNGNYETVLVVNFLAVLIYGQEVAWGTIAYFSASAPPWTRTTAADGHKGFKQQN